MLWYKAWLETRWRFLIGLALLVCSAAFTVFAYRQVLGLLPLANGAGSGEIARLVRERAAVLSTYRGYIWSQWFGQNLAQTWTLFAVLIGTGGLLTQASRGALYTLSMPVSRGRLVGVRSSLGLAELFVLALVPSLAIPALSPIVGQSYRLGDALVHAACLFVGGSVFFSLACVLSSAFADVWRPPLLVIVAAMALSAVEQFFHDSWPAGVFSVMSAERYFRGLGIPWAGLALCAVLSGAMLYGASANIARRDF